MGSAGIVVMPMAPGRRADSGFCGQVRRQCLDGPGRGEYQPGRLARHDPPRSRLQGRSLPRNGSRHSGAQYLRPGPLQRRGDAIRFLDPRQQHDPPRQRCVGGLAGLVRRVLGRVVA